MRHNPDRNRFTRATRSDRPASGRALLSARALGAPPELQLPAAGLNQVRHHAVLGHGLAVQAIRASGRAGTKVGFAENMAAAVPVIDRPEYVRAAETATRELNAAFLTVMLEGRYTDAYLADAGGRCSKVHRRGTGGHRLPGRFRRDQRGPAEHLRRTV